MTTRKIRRQDEITSIPELRGARCSAFKAVQDDTAGFVGPLYIELAGAWHRFYLDAGLLFWEQGQTPDPDDDLLDGEAYTDLVTALRVKGEAVSEIGMADCLLSIKFENGARLVLKHGVQDDGTQIIEMVPGQAHE